MYHRRIFNEHLSNPIDGYSPDNKFSETDTHWFCENKKEKMCWVKRKNNIRKANVILRVVPRIDRTRLSRRSLGKYVYYNHNTEASIELYDTGDVIVKVLDFLYIIYIMDRLDDLLYNLGISRVTTNSKTAKHLTETGLKVTVLDEEPETEEPETEEPEEKEEEGGNWYADVESLINILGRRNYELNERVNKLEAILKANVPEDMSFLDCDEPDEGFSENTLCLCCHIAASREKGFSEHQLCLTCNPNTKNEKTPHRWKLGDQLYFTIRRLVDRQDVERWEDEETQIRTFMDILSMCPYKTPVSCKHHVH